MTDLQFGHLFLVCIKYDALQEVTYSCAVGYSERYHTVVSTYRIILCFSYLLTQNRDWKGLWRMYADKLINWYYTALQLIPSDFLGPCRPIPCHVCYSLDSIFCKQLRKLSVLNDIHILVYYLQWTYIHIVSIAIQIFQTPPLIFPHGHILLCHVCYIRRFQFFGTIQQSVKFQGITFEKVRRATNRSLKMTIWSVGSNLCYEEKISARGRHYNTIHQGAPFYQLTVRAPPF